MEVNTKKMAYLNQSWGIILCVVMISIGLFTMGWYSNDLYKDYSNEKIIGGLWIPNSNQTNAIETSLKFDGLGNWVCINVKEDSYEDIIKTCTHEASHELFARTCEENVTKCMELIGK
jgi:hypothetical protein